MIERSSLLSERHLFKSDREGTSLCRRISRHNTNPSYENERQCPECYAYQHDEEDRTPCPACGSPDRAFMVWTGRHMRNRCRDCHYTWTSHPAANVSEDTPQYLAEHPARTPYTRKMCNSPERIAHACRAYARKRVEHFICLCLDTRHGLIKKHVVSIGSLSAAIVHPRETFRPAIISSAANIAIVHNHPSGNPHPSPDDITITQRLVKAGGILGIGVIDHVIISRNGSHSLRAHANVTRWTV